MIAIATAAALASGAAHAEFDVDKMPPAVYPALPREASAAEGFVPAGWVLEKRIAGDLNADGITDLALVLRENNPKNVMSNKDGLGRDPIDTNPRILAVAFGDAAGRYTLAVSNHTLIPRADNPVMDDVLDDNGGVSIARGSLRVVLHQFTSAGGWAMSLTGFTFRYQNGRFDLIGYDREETERNTGATLKISVNYSTGRMSRTTGSIRHDRTRTSWSTLPKRALPSLAEIGDGLEFDPQK